MGRIIVIEDNPVFRDHVCGMLEKAGYKTRTAYDCAGARRLLEELDDGDIIVSDLRLPDGECTEVLERMRETGIRNPFVIMTDYAQVASAVSSMRLGAEDYIPKTLLQEKLLPRISELVRKSERRHTMPILERRSAAFRTIDRRISLVAPTDIGVLILGENGTGKEHVAEKIHAQSTRQKGPFVAIDCGMLTRELAASELFGYEKGRWATCPLRYSRNCCVRCRPNATVRRAAPANGKRMCASWRRPTRIWRRQWRKDVSGGTCITA